MKATHRRRELRKRQKLTRQNVQAADPPQPHGGQLTVVGPGMLARTPSLPRLGPQRAPLDESVPAYDPNTTQMLERLPLRRILLLVRALPAATDGEQRRGRQRVEDMLTTGPWEHGEVGWKGYLYVRGDKPPLTPFTIQPPRAAVFALFLSTPLFLETVSPMGDRRATMEGEQEENDLLCAAQWAQRHLPVLPRKGVIHLGMPGSFYMHGVHHSMAAGARHQVQRFQPESLPEEEFLAQMSIVRRYSESWQQQVRVVQRKEDVVHV